MKTCPIRCAPVIEASVAAAQASAADGGPVGTLGSDAAGDPDAGGGGGGAAEVEADGLGEVVAAQAPTIATSTMTAKELVAEDRPGGMAA
jgi:hypothetical protein